MNLHFNTEIALGYKSKSQIARVLTECWMKDNMFCPICGNSSLMHYQANKPVADFYCASCHSDFELKSKESKRAVISSKIADGAYSTMIERISSLSNPHLFVMTYDNNTVNNLLLIPNFFFVPDIIEKRPPLKETARRAGWTGCNIEIGAVPDIGKIFIIRKGLEEPQQTITATYQRSLQLHNTHIDQRGWLLDVLNCIERIPGDTFSLADMYGFSSILHQRHPDNSFIKAKIRQQLQFLRDKGYLHFLSKGHYQKLF